MSNNDTPVWAPDPEDPEVTKAIEAYTPILKKIIEYCETKDSELQQEEDKAREETESKLVPLNEELKKLVEVFGAAQKHFVNISSRRALNQIKRDISKKQKTLLYHIDSYEESEMCIKNARSAEYKRRLAEYNQECKEARILSKPMTTSPPLFPDNYVNKSIQMHCDALESNRAQVASLRKSIDELKELEKQYTDPEFIAAAKAAIEKAESDVIAHKMKIKQVNDEFFQVTRAGAHVYDAGYISNRMLVMINRYNEYKSYWYDNAMNVVSINPHTAMSPDKQYNLPTLDDVWKYIRDTGLYVDHGEFMCRADDYLLPLITEHLPDYIEYYKHIDSFCDFLYHVFRHCHCNHYRFLLSDHVEPCYDCDSGNDSDDDSDDGYGYGGYRPGEKRCSHGVKKIWVADSDYTSYQDCIDNCGELGYKNDECVKFDDLNVRLLFDINSKYVLGYAERT